MKTMKLTEGFGEYRAAVWVDERGAYVTIWHVEPPPLNSWFTAVREELNDDCSVRHIYEWTAANGQ